MRTIPMNQWGEFLGTRFLGEEAQKILKQALAADSEVCLDFDGVRGVSHSFADEAVGVLAQELGLEAFKQCVRFQGLNNEIKTVLRFVVAERVTKHVA